MGGHTTPELVAAVSNAGGLGILGASRITAQQLKDAIRKIKSLTNRPFGVNLVLAPPEAGNKDVATAQRFLDRFRQELNIPLSTAILNHNLSYETVVLNDDNLSTVATRFPYQ
jgi:nitronate monooxygenase